jgi:transcription elongation GreA/GreB family factor
MQRRKWLATGKDLPALAATSDTGTARRSTAVVAPEPEDNSVVRFGHTVTIVRDDGREQAFRIVGEDEADPARGTISHASPLARALFGKGVGEVVSVAGGEAEILSII